MISKANMKDKRDIQIRKKKEKKEYQASALIGQKRSNIQISTTKISSTSSTTANFKSASSQIQQQQQQQFLTLCGACGHSLHLPPTSTIANCITASQDCRVITCANYQQGGYEQQSNSATKCRSLHKIHHQKNNSSHNISHNSSHNNNTNNYNSSGNNDIQQQQQQQNSFTSSSSTSSYNLLTNNEYTSPHFHFCCSGIPKLSLLYTKTKYLLDNRNHSNNKQIHSKHHDIGSTTTTNTSSQTYTYTHKPTPKPTTKTVASEFLCPECDIKGTSMYLYEYFSIIHELKVQYYNDEDSIYSIQTVGHPWEKNENIIHDEKEAGEGKEKERRRKNSGCDVSASISSSCTGDAGCKMAVDNGFVSFLLQREIKKYQQLQGGGGGVERKECDDDNEVVVVPSAISSSQSSTPSTSSSDGSNNNNITDDSSPSMDRLLFTKSTEVRSDHIQNILKNIPSSKHNGLRLELDDDEQQQHLNSGEVVHEKMKANNDFDPTTDLLGQPIRLFCFVTNCYYTGRIIASKIIRTKDVDRLKETTKNKFSKGTLHQSHDNKNTKHQKEDTIRHERILLDRDIGRTMYLVRFRAGIEGRKVSVHEWIFLEEHPIMIAISLVWANTEMFPYSSSCSSSSAVSSSKAKIENKRCHRVGYNSTKVDEKLTIFRPAQIFVRTALEMIMWDEINKFPDNNNNNHHQQWDASDSVNALGVFISQRFTSTVFRLTKANTLLQNKGGNLRKESSEEIADDDICKFEEKKEIDDVAKNTNNNNVKHLLVADFSNPPVILQSHLDEGKSSHEFLNVSVALATMEEEEQNRVKRHTSVYNH